MSRNIKEIGKELMGKSLNSFHRKLGLTQLEENNKMQDGILDGILSQVDDTYIEKTEQSNVIHLDGSGDGVVVLDSIEGNTMVNLWKGVASLASSWIQGDLTQEITNKILTVCNLTDKKIFFELSTIDGSNGGYSRGIFVEPNSKLKVTVTSNEKKRMTQGRFSDGWLDTEVDKFKKGVLVLEGDYTNKEISHYFEGLQSSFEEQVEEDKYKIEILSNNENLFNNDIEIGTINADDGIDKSYKLRARTIGFINVKGDTQYIIKLFNSYHINRIFYYDIQDNYIGNLIVDGSQSIFTTPKNVRKIRVVFKNTTEVDITQTDIQKIKSAIQIKKGNTLTNHSPHQQNKIKLLINEPLRSTPHNISDRLCIKDKRLVVERKCGEITLDGSEDWTLDQCFETFGQVKIGHIGFDRKNKPRNKLYSTTYTQCKIYSDNIKNAPKLTNNSTENLDTVFAGDSEHYALFVKFKNSTLGLSDGVDVGNFISKVKEYLRNKNVTVVYELATPYYEEVTNEYGEPIILEGYENGTIYIDSTIIPTTSIRYTPKMESFKALKEVNNNNIMLTNDVNDNIIPYMMDVDLMIMEKEMALMSQYKIRRIGAKDMTSMQKRTQDMLTRLIKGKTLTEQECKTRVVTYLDAGKITDAQADELMLLISEVYA